MCFFQILFLFLCQCRFSLVLTAPLLYLSQSLSIYSLSLSVRFPFPLTLTIPLLYLSLPYLQLSPFSFFFGSLSFLFFSFSSLRFLFFLFPHSAYWRWVSIYRAKGAGALYCYAWGAGQRRVGWWARLAGHGSAGFSSWGGVYGVLSFGRSMREGNKWERWQFLSSPAARPGEEEKGTVSPKRYCFAYLFFFFEKYEMTLFWTKHVVSFKYGANTSTSKSVLNLSFVHFNCIPANFNRHPYRWPPFSLSFLISDLRNLTLNWSINFQFLQFSPWFG